MISIKEAKEISITKWERNLYDFNSHEFCEADEKLKNFHKKYNTLRNYFSCGFCFRYGMNFETTHKIECCKKCELGKTEAKICLYANSLYSFIEESEEDGIKIKVAIKQLIEIIKNIPEEDE